MKDQINEQLALLERELSRLKKVTDYIDETKQTAQSIINELKVVQENYSKHTNKIFDLYESSIEKIKRETDIQIKEGVIHFETTGSKIDQTNREKLVEIKRLLENYKNIVGSTESLIRKIDSVDFPMRLDQIESTIAEIDRKNEASTILHKRSDKIIKIVLLVNIVVAIVNLFYILFK
ncbi:MAG: hypothetical protein PHT77_01405 [Bacteroidales bacterium]|nr:hypothetical protein [Bacteroidales bacterium]